MESLLREPDGSTSDQMRARRSKGNVRFFLRTFGHHNPYAYKYVACEVLNLANVICQVNFWDACGSMNGPNVHTFLSFCPPRSWS